MSVNIYDKNTDTLEMTAGRVAGAYSKPQTDALINASNTAIVGGDVWTPRSYTKGDTCIYNNVVYVCINNTDASINPTNTSYWKPISLKELNKNFGQFTSGRIDLDTEYFKSGPTISFERIGKTVQCSAAFETQSKGVPQFYELGIIPEGFVPKHDFSMVGSKLNPNPPLQAVDLFVMALTTNGKMTLRTPLLGQEWYAFTITYIVD